MGTLNLYTFRPNVLCDDENDDRSELYIQGIVEAFTDNNKDKLACFLEIKREEVLLFERFSKNLQHNTTGHYYRNHVLLDVLVMYKKYIVEFGDESAFGREVVKLCLDLVCSLYETFSCITDIVVFVEGNINTEDDFYVLLNYLSNCNYIKLQDVCKFGNDPRFKCIR